MEQFDANLRTFIESAYPALWREHLLVSIACFCMFFVLPVTVVRIIQTYERRKEKKAYLFHQTTDKKLHYTILLIMVYAGVRNVFANATVETTGGRIIAIALLGLIVITVIQMLRWKFSGIILTFTSTFVFVVFKNYTWIRGGSVNNLEKYSLIEQYLIYFLREYYVVSGMVLSLVTLLFTGFITIYYYKRRYLFRYMPTVSCTVCGNYILKGDNFCICCGTQTLANPIEDSLPQRLDKEVYCHRCGSKVHKGICFQCDETGNTAKKTIRDSLGGVFKGGLLCLVVIFLFLAPFLSNPNLEKGSSEVNNAFMKCWSEYTEDHTVANNPAWRQKYNDAADALINVDARWRYVSSNDLQYAYMLYFYHYSLASYHQMQALTEMKNLVNEGEGEVQNLAVRMNQTINEQTQAITYLTRTESTLDDVDHSLMDSIRSWVLKLGSLKVIAGGVLVLAVLSLLWAVSTFDRRWLTNTGTTDVPATISIVVTGGFVPQNYSALVKWIRQGLSAYSKRNEKQHSLGWSRNKVLSICLGLIIILVTSVVPNPFDKGPSEEELFKESVTDAVFTYSIGITGQLAEVYSTHALEDVKAFITLIDKQLDADEVIIDYEVAEELGEYQKMLDGLKTMCQDDKESLEIIKKTVEDGYVPTQEMIYNYVTIRGQNYKWLMEELKDIGMSDLVENIMNASSIL